MRLFLHPLPGQPLGCGYFRQFLHPLRASEHPKPAGARPFDAVKREGGQVPFPSPLGRRWPRYEVGPLPAEGLQDLQTTRASARRRMRGLEIPKMFAKKTRVHELAMQRGTPFSPPLRLVIQRAIKCLSITKIGYVRKRQVVSRGRTAEEAELRYLALPRSEPMGNPDQTVLAGAAGMLGRGGAWPGPCNFWQGFFRRTKWR